MKVTFLTPTPGLYGGFRVIACFAEQMQRRGHEVAVVASGLGGLVPLRSKVKSLVLGRGWPRPGARGPGPSHFDGRSLRVEVLDRRRPVVDADVPDADAVVATWWETAEWAAGLAPSKGARAYFIQQYEANFGEPVDRVEATWRLPMHKIVCSQWLADLARDRFGDPRATVAPNGLDLEQFDAPPRGKQPRPTVGIMYSSQAPKAWPIALATLLAARREVPDLHARVFGAEVPVPAFPLPPDCEFIHRPPQDRIREVYEGCDAWLCTSSSEGFHLPPHEAMACRCPVVSTRVGGPMDMVEDGVHGYLADPFDARALAERLVRVVTLPEARWREMSDAAYARARREPWAKAADRFEAGLALAVERAARGEIAGRPAGVAS